MGANIHTLASIQRGSTAHRCPHVAPSVERLGGSASVSTVSKVEPQPAPTQPPQDSFYKSVMSMFVSRPGPSNTARTPQRAKAPAPPFLASDRAIRLADGQARHVAVADDGACALVGFAHHLTVLSLNSPDANPRHLVLDARNNLAARTPLDSATMARATIENLFFVSDGAQFVVVSHSAAGLSVDCIDTAAACGQGKKREPARLFTNLAEGSRVDVSANSFIVHSATRGVIDKSYICSRSVPLAAKFCVLAPSDEKLKRSEMMAAGVVVSLQVSDDQRTLLYHLDGGRQVIRSAAGSECELPRAEAHWLSPDGDWSAWTQDNARITLRNNTTDTTQVLPFPTDDPRLKKRIIKSAYFCRHGKRLIVNVEELTSHVSTSQISATRHCIYYFTLKTPALVGRELRTRAIADAPNMMLRQATHDGLSVRTSGPAGGIKELYEHSATGDVAMQSVAQALSTNGKFAVSITPHGHLLRWQVQ